MRTTAHASGRRRNVVGIGLLRGIGVAALAVTCTAAWGFEPEVEPQPSALRCLQNDAKLEYPEGHAVLKHGGIVRVRLTFSGADDSPRTEVFYNSAGRDFEDAVLDYVRHDRVPCWTAGSSAVAAVQEFVFEPGDGRHVFWSPVRDDAPRVYMARDCMKVPDRPPSYPPPISFLRNAPTSATVFAFMKFDRSGAPSSISFPYDGGSRRWTDAVREYLARYEWSCPVSPDGINVFQQFHFEMEGDSQTFLKDAKLATFVRVLDVPEQTHRRFDFNTMGCPFQLKFILREPYLQNSVGEIEHPDPNRREFIEWLRTVRLRAPESTLQKVLGDSMTIAVPCTVLEIS